jgi:hypothetical protein
VEDALFLLFFVLVYSIMGAIAAAIAHYKGRSVVGWFFGGFFLGIVGIIVVAVLPNAREERAYREHLALDNRRLREKLEQERLKSEAFRRHVAGRLDVHDEQLGLDTRSLQTALPSPDQASSLLDSAGGARPGQYSQQLPGQGMNANGLSAPLDGQPASGHGGQSLAQVSGNGFASFAEGASSSPLPPQRQWFYEYAGESHGPVLEHELQQMLRIGRLDGATLVWSEPIGEWVAARRVSVLKPFVSP